MRILKAISIAIISVLFFASCSKDSSEENITNEQSNVNQQEQSSNEDNEESTTRKNEIVFAGKSYPLDWGEISFEGLTKGRYNEPIGWREWYIGIWSSSITFDLSDPSWSHIGEGWGVEFEPLYSEDDSIEGDYIGFESEDSYDFSNNPMAVIFAEEVLWDKENFNEEWNEHFINKNGSGKISKNGTNYVIEYSGEDERGIKFEMYYNGLLIDTSNNWDFTTTYPYTPINPSPEDGAEVDNVNPVLSWESGDPDSDNVLYTIYFGDNLEEFEFTPVIDGQLENSYQPGYPLVPGNTYYWRIYARDADGNSTASRYWSFTVSASAQGADKTFIPDDNFEQTLIDLGYDNVLDDYVLTDNIKDVIILELDNKGISSLVGIESFENLSTLICTNNQLTEIDVSQNIQLEYLNISLNQLTHIDVSSNNKLKELTSAFNQLTTIDVSQNNDLTELKISQNPLTGINLSQNNKLEILYINDTDISNLDLSLNSQLNTLFAVRNKLTSIDVSNNILLAYLWVSENSLSSIVFGLNTNLTVIALNGNQLTNLDVSQITQLSELYLQGNSLQCIQVNQNQIEGSIEVLDIDSGVNLSLDCNNPGGGQGNVEENGLTSAINNLVSENILDEMIAQGMTINTGGSPPILDNTYLASPLNLIGSTVPNDQLGLKTYEISFKLYDQNYDQLTIAMDLLDGSASATNPESFIVGSNDDFSIFSELIVTNQNGELAQSIFVISGTKQSTGLINVKIVNYMVDDYGDPNNSWIPNGSFRILKDDDGFSEIINSSKSSSKNSKKFISGILSSLEN